MATTGVSHPLVLELDAGLQITRWRPLVQWLLAIPHLLITNVLRSLRQVLTLISLFTVLFTKRIPPSLFAMIVMTHRYDWRVVTYAGFMREAYPPFDFNPGCDDNQLDPHTTLSLAYPGEMKRWAPLYKWFLAIPHYVVIVVLSVGAAFALLAALVAVIATGRYPEGIRRFLVNAYRYAMRVEVYVSLLTDTYPPFSLSA